MEAGESAVIPVVSDERLHCLLSKLLKNRTKTVITHTHTVQNHPIKIPQYSFYHVIRPLSVKTVQPF
jgi:hypothetical protein